MAIYALDDVRGGKAVVAGVGKCDTRGGDLVVENVRD